MLIFGKQYEEYRENVSAFIPKWGGSK